MKRTNLRSLVAAMCLASVAAACGASPSAPATPESHVDLPGGSSVRAADAGVDAPSASSAAAIPEPAMPESCDGLSANRICRQIAKGGGPNAIRARDALREICTRRGTIESCAVTIELFGASLPPAELAKAAHEACNAAADDHDAALLQGVACLHEGDAQDAKGKRFLAADAYEKGCRLEHAGCCDAVKRVHAELASEGRDIETVQFPMGGIRDSSGGYRLDDVGCHLEKSAELTNYFFELADPFFKRKKEVVACIGKDGSVPVRWHTHGGKVIEVHANGSKATCLSRALVGAKSGVDVECGGVVMSGEAARAQDAK